MMLKKMISGGQTGVDRAALDVGLKLHIPIGGACPKGRGAEDGPISSKYPLHELNSSNYSDRTRQNVADSDGTLILYIPPLSGGTALTKNFAEDLKKPYFVMDLNEPKIEAILEWLEEQQIEVLNVAGPRESKNPGIYERAARFLEQLLSSLSTPS